MAGDRTCFISWSSNFQYLGMDFKSDGRPYTSPQYHITINILFKLEDDPPAAMNSVEASYLPRVTASQPHYQDIEFSSKIHYPSKIPISTSSNSLVTISTTSSLLGIASSPMFTIVLKQPRNSTSVCSVAVEARASAVHHLTLQVPFHPLHHLHPNYIQSLNSNLNKNKNYPP